MRNKIRGVTIQVSENFYRMIERLRYEIKRKNKVKINSHKQISELIAKNMKINNLKNWFKTQKK